MNDIIAALIEWRDAREAFWKVPAVPPDKRFPPEIWRRLGEAEDRLMTLARKLESEAGFEPAPGEPGPRLQRPVV